MSDYFPWYQATFKQRSKRNVKNYITCGSRLSQVPYIGKMQLKSIQNILSSFSIKMQENVMRIYEIAVSLFRILWISIQLLQQMVDIQHPHHLFDDEDADTFTE